MRTLTLERGCDSTITPGHRICLEWFHEVPGADGKYHESIRAEICANALDKYVTVSKRFRFITLVASKRETPNCFNIKRDGTLIEVREWLDVEFQTWLRKSYRAGERFVQVEIGL